MLLHSKTSILLLLFGAVMTVYAQDTLEEIVVTAGFYETTLMQSTGSISVMDTQAIRDRAARHLDETINAFPNVNFSSGGSRARFLQVRGVGDLEQFVDPKHYPSVGITVDDIDLGTAAATAAVLMDVDQIEVLRGPQGTRFGANALAGMVNIQTMAPPDSFTGRIEAGYGNYDSWFTGLTLGGPLAEQLSGRLAVQQHKSDGFISNAFLNSEATNNREELSVHGKLHWTGDYGARVNLTGLYLDVDSGYDAFSLDNNRTTWTDTPGNDRQETYALAAKAMMPVHEDIELELLLNWNHADEAYGFDEDWVFSGYCDGIRCNPLFEFSSSDQLYRDRDVVSIDARFKSGAAAPGWVAGVYYQQRNEDLERQHFAPFFSDYATERYAVYGQFSFAPAETWRVTAGLRYEHFNDDYHDTNALVTASSDAYWSGELTAEYLASEHTLWYATLSRGVKPGGINTETSSNQPFMSAALQPFINSRLQFSAETLFNKELGIKGRYLDERLAVRLALFHMDRLNAQLESWIWDANNFIWTGFLDSGSDAQNYGAELELDYRLTHDINLFANLGYLQTNVDQVTVYDLDMLQFRTLVDRDQAKSPEWQYNMGFTFDLTDQLHGRLEVEGRDRSFYGYYHDGVIDGYTLAHASISYNLGNVELQAWIRNITGEDYSVHALYFANDPRDGFANNQTYFQFGEPRVFGVNASYAF
jgi:outer membrane receptor protein involved in Fe transport